METLEIDDFSVVEVEEVTVQKETSMTTLGNTEQGENYTVYSD